MNFETIGKGSRSFKVNDWFYSGIRDFVFGFNMA